ncbi:MAG: two-component sensor histidine kinase [Rhodoferax sp.]|nr:two-component sensor histidine kinase [Rhodoferax sp.]
MPESSGQRSEQRIAALEAQLAALRAEMQEFTYTVSHDLRAPLRHIMAYAQLVQEDAAEQLSAEVQGFLITITDSARHMGVLLDGLTALSRLGVAPVTLASVPLQPLVQEVCAELQTQAGQRSLQWRIATDLPPVRADAALLRQALLHVLGNAVKFTSPRAQALVDMTFARDAATNLVALEIADNGVGYNPALQDKLFKTFSRLHSSKAFEGLGLGLALTHKIMQRLDGSVQASGVLDGGCRVTLRLPTA